MKQRPEIQDSLITKNGAANNLTVCVRTIENLMQARQLAYIRIGRAVRSKRTELERFKKTFTVQAAD